MVKRSLRLCFLLSSLFGLAFASEKELKQAQKQGQDFAKSKVSSVWDSTQSISDQDFLPIGNKGKKFDPSQAKAAIKQQHVDSEVLDFVLSKEVQANQKQNRSFSDDNETSIINVIRTLKVRLANQGSVEKTQVCLGHTEEKLYLWKDDAKEAVKKYEKRLTKDHSIQSHRVSYAESFKGGYLVTAQWMHKDDTQECDHFKTKKLKEASIETEEWVYNDPSAVAIINSPDYTLVQQLCLDSNTTKMINGQAVTRKCWKEKLSFLSKSIPSKDSSDLKTQDPLDTNVFYGEWDTTYIPNSSFAEVATKLSIFDGIKKEIEAIQALDASQMAIFKGNKQKCTKNVADGLLYDCCFSYSGLAKQAGLSKCTAEEISLADAREKGLCHYIGSYDEKMLGAWKSRDVHVFCCYPTKLARLVQEEGRKQIGKNWGSAKHPKCEGFSFEELSKLDFSKMDLSELFDQLPNQLPAGFEQKMDAFQNRLRDQIKKESSHD